MAKTEFLQIRVTPEDMARVRESAEADYLDTSTWARRAILRAVEEAERRKKADAGSIESIVNEPSGKVD